ncbi:hypothetical protein M8697_002437 [Providencia rettgeri]|nr:hypothetical protein [Providencia rettgeri]
MTLRLLGTRPLALLFALVAAVLAALALVCASVPAFFASAIFVSVSVLLYAPTSPALNEISALSDLLFTFHPTGTAPILVVVMRINFPVGLLILLPQ